MLNYIHQLELVFKENANPEKAKWQIQYMRNQFGGFGIASPVRNELQKPFLDKKHLPTKTTAFEIIKILWEKPEREFQYFAMQLASKYIKEQELADIELYEWMLLHKSWWDTVDYITPELVGKYFQKFPEMRDLVIEKWLEGKPTRFSKPSRFDQENIWLQRSCLIFQLRKLLGSKEFFINKAIGWSLRQYARTNPNWVLDFVENTPELSGLSRREAVRRINSK